MQLKQLLTQYNIIEAQMLYNKAVDILSLITDTELEEILTVYPELFASITNAQSPELFARITNAQSTEELLKDSNTIRKVIDIFIQKIESRNLTLDEFDAMTLDDIKAYLENIITKKDNTLYSIIHAIENSNDTRNQTN